MKYLLIILLFVSSAVQAQNTKLYAVRFNANGSTDSFWVNPVVCNGVYNSAGSYLMPCIDSMNQISGYNFPQSAGLFFQRADGIFSNLMFPGSTAIPQSQVTDLTTDLAGKLATNGNGSSLTGLTKSQVGLANADNTSDANKPVSSATQTALNLKANLASPTFTGTVGGITATMVGLGNVNNTSDASKPISTATQAALDGKQATLVSATNIKTVNGSTLLGSGDLVVGGGAVTTTAGVGASPTASSTQTITHNLGRIPNTIRIYGYGTFTSNAAATATTSSMGVFNSSGNFCVYQRYGAAITTTQAALSSNTFAILLATGGGNFISGVIQNVTDTQFDIVWTETGTATAQVYLWEAQ